MPYIIMKRDDIPNGSLQILDLTPNESRRNAPYQPVGQTKYVRVADRATPSLLTNGGVITFASDSYGLTAWFLTNVSDGTGAAAAGTITTIIKASFVDNETFVISDGITAKTFAIHKTGAYVPVVGEIEVDITADVTANNVRDRIITAINGVTSFFVTASSGGASTVALVNDNNGTAGNVTVTDTVANVGFSHTGMAGGVDADALSASDAADNTTAVLGLLNFGAAGAAGALTLGAINGALATGVITTDQLPDVLDILAGREYLVPAGTQIQAASAFGIVGTPGFVAGTLRSIFAGESLSISFGSGLLAKMRSNSFSYAGAQTAAVAVYNDDGSLFTG